MIPSSFEYERAMSLDDALHKLRAANGTGKLIAGGHSLVPLMKLRLSEPTVLIDIGHISDLAGVHSFGEQVTDGDLSRKLQIGALTTHHDVAMSSVLHEQCPAVVEAARSIGDSQVRNRGTLGGSLAHADPAADYPAVMLALDADMHMVSIRGGMRAVKASDFFQGVFTVDLAQDEILTKVTFTPILCSAYAKLYQRASRFAIVGVAAALEVTDGVITTARVALTGATSKPTRLANVEATLVGQPASVDGVTAAVTIAGEEIKDLNDDIHASAEYRLSMIPVFTRRALGGALARA